jgi:hypothetical protein
MGQRIMINQRGNLKNKIECKQILFSPSKDSWVVANSKGLFVYRRK